MSNTVIREITTIENIRHEEKKYFRKFEEYGDLILNNKWITKL